MTKTQKCRTKAWISDDFVLNFWSVKSSFYS